RGSSCLLLSFAVKSNGRSLEINQKLSYNEKGLKAPGLECLNP
ncbi:MAG: hypothetical protein ACI9WO_001903, partial [Sphingobacteriales bacterium]